MFTQEGSVPALSVNKLALKALTVYFVRLVKIGFILTALIFQKKLLTKSKVKQNSSLAKFVKRKQSVTNANVPCQHTKINYTV